MKFNNKVIVVTGAGGGVGRQLVLKLLEKGAAVAAVDINQSALEKTKISAGDNAVNISTHVVDITDRDRVCLLPDEVIAFHGKIDGLLNNAGIIQDFIPFTDLNGQSVDRQFNINFYGMVNMTQIFIPYLAERSEAYIGNVSSMGGFLPIPGQSIYGASKAAVKIATEGLRIELSRTNIRVSLIIPGGIETDIKKNSGLKNADISEEDKKSAGIKLTTAEKAADIILKGIEKGKGRILIGSDCKMMDILYRIAPLKAGEIISKEMAENHGDVFNTSKDLSKIKI